MKKRYYLIYLALFVLSGNILTFQIQTLITYITEYNINTELLMYFILSTLCIFSLFIICSIKLFNFNSNENNKIK